MKEKKEKKMKIEKKKLLNRNGKKKLQNGSEGKNTRNGSERKNTRNGNERMKWNLSCKKYALEQKIKREVSQEVKDHFIDDWSKLNSPDDLVEKLDDYDTLRSTFSSKEPRKEWHYDKQNSLEDDSAFTTNERKKLYGITHNERGEPKCFNCSKFRHIVRNCSLLKSVLTFREYSETDHKDINCVAKETNHSSDESLSVRRVGENSEKSNSFLKKAEINNCGNMQALIDTGSLGCLLMISIAQKLKLKFERAVNKIYFWK
ncbi:hypothetical protein AVEN_53391-1 [Araneus ventricosus]|uniref:CCHC-type domain-containing protein n=1 Tax=Araneus ventricosus TaxID=182803 RepID=A0A4Y2AAH8_ARAVE|nr:hypothetical protein AVEN_53391-1 [Araneus ventricosus]